MDKSPVADPASVSTPVDHASPTAMAPDASTSPLGHTAGPWDINGTDETGAVLIIGENLGGLVGAALPWPTEIEAGGSDRVRANARLIAAAPELLEALEALLADCGEVMSDGYVENSIHGDEVAVARAAIAKARAASSAPEVSHVG